MNHQTIVNNASLAEDALATAARERRHIPLGKILPGVKLKTSNDQFRSWPMFLRITTDPAPRPTSLGELGIASESNPRVSLNEFTYKKGAEIYGEKEPADYVYQVKAGAVRSYKLLSDGRRQIGAFHLAGDIFGLENGSEHRFTAGAIGETTV